MGTWGYGVFENDAACDLASTVAEEGGISALAKALVLVLSSEGKYLESLDAKEGLAAAEIVARLRGHTGRETAYTALIDSWVKTVRITASDELVEKAKLSITRILSEPSELRELWTDSDNFDAWKRSVQELLQRLK